MEIEFQPTQHTCKRHSASLHNLSGERTRGGRDKNGGRDEATFFPEEGFSGGLGQKSSV